MRCQNCECEIPPAFVTAIANNTCPGCGKEIMDLASKELMDEFAKAFEKMPNDPQGLAGWLLSNYRVTKIGSGEPVERFHRPIDKKAREDQPEPKSNLLEKFRSRTDYKEKPDINDKINKIKNKNKGSLSKIANQINSVEDDEEFISDDEDISQDDMLAMYKMLENSGEDPGSVFDSNDIENALIDELADDQDSSVYITQEEQLLRGSKKGQEMLNNERRRRIKAQSAITSGGGAFKRA